MQRVVLVKPVKRDDGRPPNVRSGHGIMLIILILLLFLLNHSFQIITETTRRTLMTGRNVRYHIFLSSIIYITFDNYYSMAVAGQRTNDDGRRL